MLSNLLWAYIAIVNLAGFIAMGWDKRKAMKNDWRTPEKTLLGIAIIGGSLGTYLGMRLFRHKTKHWQFYIGVPFIMLLQVAALLLFTGKLG